jgi:cytochrome c551/c552
MQENSIKLFYIPLLIISSLYGSDNMGSLLFHGNCITCHNKDKSISAPSINKIKEHYLQAFPNKKDFVEHMSKWIIKPDKTTSIMLHAIKKYELMPELGFDINTTQEISKYIYDTDFSKKHINSNN